MRFLKYLGLTSAILLLISCTQPWVTIESHNIIVTGFHSTGTNFGQPGWFHVFMTVIFVALTLIDRVWAKRANLLVTALNIGWAVRNYFIISGCEGGDCPVRKIWFYLVMLSSLLMLVSALFPDMKIQSGKS